MKKFTLILYLLISASSAFAHGENVPGPHGGFVRMPGAFHSELKQLGPSQVAVYLLDFKFRNPLTRGSSVAASIDRAGIELKLNCAKGKSRFVCTLPKGEVFKTGDSLKLQTERQGSPGAPVLHDFPFKREAGHGRHP